MSGDISNRRTRSASATGSERGTYRSHTLTDAAEQAKHQEWVDLDIHQLSAGSYQGACSVLSGNNMHVVHEQQNQLIYKSGYTPKNSCTVSLCYGTDPAMRFTQFQSLMESWLFFLPQETEFDINVPAGLDTLYVCLEQDRLMEDARILNEQFWEKPPKDLHAFNTPHTGRLASDLAMLAKNMNPAINLSAQGGKMLVDSLLLALNSSTEIVTGNTPEYHARKRVYQLVKTAREYIDACLQIGNIPSIVEICAQLSVSERTLQYAFKQDMQLSPVTYLRILRLNKARTTLLSVTPAETTVTHIAMMWGFLHLGKFSQDYRRMFGELPSETLARTTSSL
jgi:AraC family ethanolamine operon transcriptional activator